MAFTSPWEGERHPAYQDSVGVWTICYGETRGVHAGMRMTHQQCVAQLEKRIPDYLRPVDRMMPGLPDNRRVAYTDFAYNVGAGHLSTREGGRLGTSIIELEHAGRWQDACKRMNKFIYAGGRVLPGLVRRRNAEVELCLKK
ncbi:lysozyme [Chromobacterium vaccinii]|uniref:lysozyme n=1 Tax=Chromobacterium vaccinii TaxID=1108595 RepID=UPI003C739D95